MPLRDVVSNTTDLTLRPDLPPTETPRSRFIPLKLPFFEHKINLPPHVKPKDAWGIFKLFFTKELVECIVRHTNEHVDHLDLWKLNKEKPKSRLYQWKPMTIEEAYNYLGIRIYMSIHVENQME